MKVLGEPGRTSVKGARLRLRLLLVAVLVLTMQCAKKPGIRFYPTWPDDMLLSEAWTRGDTSLAYDLLALDEETYHNSMPYGVRLPEWFRPSSFRQFTVVVHGQLPPGDIAIRAIYMKDGQPVTTASVEPGWINSSHSSLPGVIGWDEVKKEPGYAAFRMTRLTAYSPGDTAFRRIMPGRYYISLETSGKELCGSNLTIREGPETYQ